MPDYSLEQAALDRGYTAVCGVDEAGRGPLAGPVCAAAVILPLGLEIPGLNDSKKLTEKRREALFDAIVSSAVAYSVAFASVGEIEELNILNADFLAMNRAIAGLQVAADFAIIDGNQPLRNAAVPSVCVVKGDSKSMSVAAASVLAKVSRDRLMLEYAKQYPDYGFDKHKGYGTKAHYAALRQFGPCEIHRPSFLRKFQEQESYD